MKIDKKYIKDLKSFADKIKFEVGQEKNAIKALLKKTGEQKEKIIKIQKIKKDSIKFKNFFNEKLSFLNLIDRTNNDRDQLEKGLSELVKKAKSFQLTSKSVDVGKEMLYLENKFKEVDERKSIFETGLKKLTKSPDFRVFKNN